MIFIKTIFAVRDKKMPFWLQQKISQVLEEQDGRRVVITIETEKKYRSHSQNSFYYGVVLPLIYSMFKDCGNNVTKQEVHMYLKEHVGKLVKQIHDPNGESESVVSSSSDLTTTEWESWLENIRSWAAEFGVIVPLPNELSFIGDQP